MKDPEFISLLNLYVDREISPEDALRLETEVLADPKRREVYDQYCRMQKACAMLSSQPLEQNLRRTRADVLAFPGSGAFSWGSALGGLAAAAVCAFFIVGYKLHRAEVLQAQIAPVVAGPALAAAPALPVTDAAAMKPVVVLRLSDGSAARPLFASDSGSGITELNWMQSINMSPVFNAANPELLKTDAKATGLAASPSAPAAAEPAEMTAFRFQR